MRQRSLLFLCSIPILEALLFFQLSVLWGVFYTIFGSILTTVLGFLIIRHKGLSFFRADLSNLQNTNLSIQQFLDGAYVLVSAIFLVIPGFFTDFLGLILLLPFTRTLIKTFLSYKLAERIFTKKTMQEDHSKEFGPIIEGDYETLDNKINKNNIVEEK